MKSIRILDSLPNFFDIYKNFENTTETVCVFEDNYYFKEDCIPSDLEREIINRQVMHSRDCLILTDELINIFGQRFRVSSNCIHVYNKAGQQDFLFKNLQWDWAYYCHDDSLIEIFINEDNTAAYHIIKNKYECVNIMFPGSILKPGGMRLL